MKHIAVFANQKGGVGKTTCTVNIGFALAMRGRRVLLVDMDPQGNLTSWCGLDPDDCTRTIYDVIKGTAGIADVAATVSDSLDVVPANILLASVEREIFAQIGYEKKIKRAIEPILDSYDHVLIDCPPSLGALTINGMVASHEVYITVSCEHLSVIGTNKLIETIEAVRENYNPGLEIGKVIPTMFTNTVLAGEMVKQLETYFGEKVTTTRIRRNVKIGECSAMGESIFQYDPKSIGAEDFEQLVEEIL
jgi:chromosome partitioning protein